MLARGVELLARRAAIGGSSASRMRSAVGRGLAERRRPRAARRTRRRRSGRRCRPARTRARRRRADLEQQLVAGGVAEAVVDGLEVVEVDEEDGDPRARRARRARARAATRSLNSARLARSVTGSWKAWCASCSSNALRSLTSRLFSTMPCTCSSRSRSVCSTSNCSSVPSPWRSAHSRLAPRGAGAVLAGEQPCAAAGRPRSSSRSKRVPDRPPRRA